MASANERLIKQKKNKYNEASPPPFQVILELTDKSSQPTSTASKGFEIISGIASSVHYDFAEKTGRDKFTLTFAEFKAANNFVDKNPLQKRAGSLTCRRTESTNLASSETSTRVCQPNKYARNSVWDSPSQQPRDSYKSGRKAYTNRGGENWFCQRRKSRERCGWQIYYAGGPVCKTPKTM